MHRPASPGNVAAPFKALDGRVRWWLARAGGLIDVCAVTRLWEECLEGAADDVEPALVHGDLIPGNLLLADAHLTGVIDRGGLGAGDPAQDLDPAWSVLDAAGAAALREALDVDEPSWLRARGFTLEHAVGGIVYYTPRRHPLGDVMQRTLDRLLSLAQPVLMRSDLGVDEAAPRPAHPRQLHWAATRALDAARMRPGGHDLEASQVLLVRHHSSSSFSSSAASSVCSSSGRRARSCFTATLWRLRPRRV